MVLSGKEVPYIAPDLQRRSMVVPDYLAMVNQLWLDGEIPELDCGPWSEGMPSCDGYYVLRGRKDCYGYPLPELLVQVLVDAKDDSGDCRYFLLPEDSRHHATFPAFSETVTGFYCGPLDPERFIPMVDQFYASQYAGALAS